MTYQELRDALNALTPEQLARDAVVSSETGVEKVNDLFVADEPYVNPSGDGWEPISNYADEPEAIEGEPHVCEAGYVSIEASR